MKVQILFIRPGRPDTIYVEGLVDDDGCRLRTSSVVPGPDGRAWSKKWQAEGKIDAGQTVRQVLKYHFYHEPFSVMELRGQEGLLLGYYCDINLPLECIDGRYRIVDLKLDLWIKADGSLTELDWDEFTEACDSGLITPEQQALACQTLERLKLEAGQGIFPHQYIR